MSRIGKKPVDIPKGIEVKLEGNKVFVKGPLGSLSQDLHNDMIVKMENGQVIIERPTELKKHKSLHGLTRTLVANMVEGVVKGFEKKLTIVGVGYRAQMQGSKLVMNLGYSHPVEFIPDPDIKIEAPTQTSIIIKGIDKQKVGQVAAMLRSKKVPDVYKGKGIRYENEIVKLKEGKTGSK
jgi:large subunit ribosomal protein L6